jgi:ribA/ribD-fused uncharacterized protein
MKNEIKVTDRFVFFWNGWPSQWFASEFTIDGVTYNCCEQFMMAEKARFFDDQETLKQVLESENPREQKALGRRVRNFDESKWNQVCRGIVWRANHAKFSQNPALLQSLIETGDRIIVEASPTDRIWGIGLGADDPRAEQPSLWRGKNWLGIALMQVREALRPREGHEPPVMIENDELNRQLALRRSMIPKIES